MNQKIYLKVFLILSGIILAGILEIAPAVVRASASSDQVLALGIDRSNLTRQSPQVLTSTLQGIHALNAIWFRDVLSNASPDGIKAFVQEVQVAKQNQLKFLANILPTIDDYDDGYQSPNAGDDFRKRCGWPQGSAEISKMNMDKFAKRLRAQFDAVKKAGLTIDAFEIGNEVDWICFNGDVPDGRAPAEQDLMRAVRGYARFLKTAAEIIRDPHYFPQAKIITFGIAHGNDVWDRPPHHFANPARMVAMLRNLDGYNYLDNDKYHIDGYGTHLYSGPDDIAETVEAKLEQDIYVLGRDKPYWVTEWGFSKPDGFPNKKAQSVDEALNEFIAALYTINRATPIGPIMFYSYNNWLTDASGHLLPLGRTLAAHGATKQ